MKDQVLERGADVCPALDAGIRLHGEMPDVGFTTKQWLIERNGQFLQVSELLYRVAEQMDGARPFAEIAARVTETSECMLESEHVAYLIEQKLRPLGIVASEHGDIAPTSGAAPVDSSPLRLNMRMRMFPPRFVERSTRVLQYAYAPALLIPTAGLIAFAHWWVYSGSGVQRGVEKALYVPGAMGAVLLLTIIAGLFHELGHSAALRYGGGKPRGIGFGLYLMFPAFYSDVTDGYRLNRMARIRTDLGGIYFHLIFAAGLMAIAAVTRNEFLIAAALVFNVEAVRQLIPLVRLDGYWLLADLTGVPDFVSQVRVLTATVRTRGGQRAGQAGALPQFKPWVALAFALYLLLTIPAIVFLVVWMVMFLPELWVLTQNALLVQTELWSAAQPWTRFLIGVQIALLPVPLLATSYFLYVTLAAVAAQIWARSGRTAPSFPVRRLAGATALAGAAAAGAFSLTPATPGSSAAFASALENRVDPAALLRRVQDAISGVNMLEADLTGRLGEEIITGTLALSRPNRADIEVRGAPDSLGTFHVVSDGAKLLVFFPGDKTYTETSTAADGSNINALLIDQVTTFFKPERLAPRAGQRLSYMGQEEVGGVVYDVLAVRANRKDGDTRRYYIAPETYLVHRVVTTRVQQGKTLARTIELANLRINGHVKEARFRRTLPVDATPLSLDMLGVQLPPGVTRN